MDDFIRTVVSVCDYVKAKKRSKKQINLSFDEWNVWFHASKEDADTTENHPWQKAPHLLEDHYTFEDALMVGLMMITLLKHADRVKIACLAQLVNVIAPIMTEENGIAWRQTIFYPFYHASRYGRGTVLQLAIDSPKHETGGHGSITDVEAVAVWNEEAEEVTVFAVNRNLEEDLPLTMDLRSFEGYELIGKTELVSDDLQTVNSAAGEKVHPRQADDAKAEGGQLETVLRKASWNVIRLGRK